MTAPGYFVGNPDYTGFLLHHCVHAMDLVPWLMGEPVETVTARRFEIAAGQAAAACRLRLRARARSRTVVMGTHQSRGTPMEWWQVMGDHKRVEVRNVHEVRYFRAPPFQGRRTRRQRSTRRRTRLIWEPNQTAAANEDHKGYHALLGGLPGARARRALDAPDLADGARAMACWRR